MPVRTLPKHRGVIDIERPPANVPAFESGEAHSSPHPFDDQRAFQFGDGGDDDFNSAAWIKQHYHWSAIIQGIVSFDPTVVMLIATVLLILTPVARVVVSIYAFAVERDHNYVVVTSIVLFVMIVTVILGLFGLK